MQQQMSLITLGIADVQRSRRFYMDGFGWTPVFQNDEIAFCQMNGFVLGTWLTSSLEGDMRRPGLSQTGAFALAHNVASRDAVQPMLDRLARVGGRLLRPAGAPPHGGSAATSPTPTTTPGRSPGIRCGRSARRDM